MSVVVQATLLDFRFRLKSFKSVQEELANFYERAARESSSDKKRKSHFKKNQMGDQPQPEPLLPPPFIPQTVADFIFADEFGQLPQLLDL